MKLSQAKALYQKARTAYFEGSPILTDEEYDSLEDKLPKEWVAEQKTGARPIAKVVRALHMPMPSLSKMRPEEGNEVSLGLKSIRRFGSRALTMLKLDGSSIQLIYHAPGKLTDVVTRGDGKFGKSVMHLAEALSVPKVVQWDEAEPLVLRCEAVMRKDTFAEKWQGVFNNSRAVASGLLNRSSAHEALSDLDFIVIRVLSPSYSLQEGLEFAKTLGFKTVPKAELNLSESDSAIEKRLIRTLAAQRDSFPYALDGLVVHSSANKLPKDTEDKPKYAFAFKVNEFKDAPSTTIREIRWTISPYGILVPTAIFDQIELNESTVTKASLYNAGWAKDRNVGVGSVVKVLKSGDIIPRIVTVVRSTKFEYPDQVKLGEYDWGGCNTYLKLLDPASSPEVKAAKLVRFFTTMEIDGFASALASKLVAAGYDTVPKVLKMRESHFRTLPNIKDSAIKLSETISALRETEHELSKLMVASGVFNIGIGLRRAERFTQIAPGATKHKRLPDGEIYHKIANAKVGYAATDIIYQGWPSFINWLVKTGLQYKITRPKKPNTTKGPCTGLFGTWTGYRDKEEEKIFEDLGGKVVNFGATTNVLFHAPNGKISTKVEKAAQKGILCIQDAKPYFSRLCKKFEESR